MWRFGLSRLDHNPPGSDDRDSPVLAFTQLSRYVCSSAFATSGGALLLAPLSPAFRTVFPWSFSIFMVCYAYYLCFFSAEQLASLYCLCFTCTAFCIESFVCMLRPYIGWKLSSDTYFLPSQTDETGDSDLEQKQFLKIYKFLQKRLLPPIVESGGGRAV